MTAHHLNPAARSGLILLLCLMSFGLSAQGLRGKVVDEKGDPLPFTAIAVYGSQKGTASNAEGDYSLSLEPGTYRIRFQFLGYRAIDTTFQIGQRTIRFDPVMPAESIALPEAIVTPGNEDPAYTIMRRAIAKAKYHAMQVDEYHARVYLKGSGRLLKTPWLFRKQINKALAEEGIDSTVAFTQESVSKLHFLRPDQYRDTVVSIRTTGNDNNTSPMNFIYSSFYEPKVVTAISPLAPDAFGHYRFEYLGYIVDRGQHVNKIKVIPKSRGDQIFEGVIYIVDNSWSIHSLDLTTSLWGIRFRVKQQFSPVLPDVWMPVHEIYDVDGKILGFAFEYRYFASLSDYRIQLNPDLEVPLVVLDGKLHPEEAREADKKIAMNVKPNLSGLDPGAELSAKKLRKMMREYEKEEIEIIPETDTVQFNIGASQQYVDSLASRRDTAYWQEVRPLPLTEYEVRGYARQDSMAAIPPQVDDKEPGEPSDTLSLRLGQDGFDAEVQRRSAFKLTHLVTGGRYDLGDRHFLKLRALLQTSNFNTVDGYHFGYGLEFGNRQKKKINWAAGPEIHYALSREVFNYAGRLRLFGKGWDVSLRGGSMTEQYGYDHPIPRWANTAYTLLVNDNFMKLYEQRFGRLAWKQELGKAFGLEASVLYSERHRLVNTTDFILIDNKNRFYSANDPVTASASGDLYSDHKALITDVSVWARPFWKWRFNRGTKRKDYSDSPKLTVGYRKGWGDNRHPFDLVRAQFESRVNIGAGSLLSLKIGAGMFIGNDKPVYFHDFAHMPGNQMIATSFNPVFAFRNLPYYLYSTDDQYAFGLFNYQFRRFALTQFHYFRRQGIRENLLFNALFTPESDQYMEVGYALNYLFRIFRVEFVTSWQDFRYHDFAIRIGVATDFQSLFRF